MDNRHTKDIVRRVKFYSGDGWKDFKKVSKSTGLHISTVRKLLYRKEPVNTETLCLICEALEVEILFKPRDFRGKRYRSKGASSNESS